MNAQQKYLTGNQDLNIHSSSVIEGRVFIHDSALVEPHVYIKGPTFIGPNTEVRQGAYIRGSLYAGKGCIIGHNTECKSSVFFDEAKAGHFAYVGNSILCRKVNLGQAQN